MKKELSDEKKPTVKRNKYFEVDPWVFWPSAILIVLFIGITLIVGEPMELVFTGIQDSISEYGGWFFILSVNFFLIFFSFRSFQQVW